MKNIYKFTALIVIAAVASFALTGCESADNPKALAKKTYDLSKEILASVTDLSKTERLTKEAAALAGRVDKLSKIDKITFQVELARLAGSDASSLLQGMDLTGSLKELQNSLNSKEIQNALNSLKETGQ